MLMFLFLIISMFLFGFALADDCPSMWVKYQNKCYLFTTNQLPYAQCNTACSGSRTGATMLCVENMDQNNFIQSSLQAIDTSSPSRSFFLGYYRNVNGQFAWVSGCESSFTNWDDNEPNNQYNQESYAEMYTHGRWNDIFDDLRPKCACEFSIVLSSDQPSSQPSGQPSEQPSNQPSNRPSDQPSDQPSAQPSNQPSDQPSGQPTLQPSSQPTKQPSGQPSNRPSDQPSSQPLSQPSAQPSSHPSDQPSSQPTLQPSSQPTQQPSGQPSNQPSDQPSSQPLSQPNDQPASPTAKPTPQIVPTPLRHRLPPLTELYDRANTPATRRQQSATRHTQSGDRDGIKSKINKMREKVAAMRGEL